MKWIDKSRNKTEGDQVAKDYLEACCRQLDGRYLNVRYDKRDAGAGDSFCTANGGIFRKRLTNILLENQEGYCCYCMRKIKTAQMEQDSDEVVTREHIIPRAFSQKDLTKLTTYYQQCPELSKDQVILTDEFEEITHNQSDDLPPYPHKIAYNNLVASCNGTFPYKRNDRGNKQKICCNEERHDNDAFPIYFIRNIADMIDYLDNGDIHPKCTVAPDIQQKIEDVIENTKLACNELKDIRRLWFILSHIPKERVYSCKTVAQRNKLFSETLYKAEFFEERNVYLHEKFQKSDFWETFMLYDYFYDVYHKVA